MAYKIFTIQIEDFDNTSLDEMIDIIGNTLSEKGIDCTYNVQTKGLGTFPGS